MNKEDGAKLEKELAKLASARNTIEAVQDIALIVLVIVATFWIVDQLP